MNQATGIRIHDHQTRLGKPTVHGAYFPKTDRGDEVAMFHDKHQVDGPTVGVMVNLATIRLSPNEARAMAFTLLHHAKQVDPECKS